MTPLLSPCHPVIFCVLLFMYPRSRPGGGNERRAVVRQPTWVLHLDVDAFFAAVEQRDDPALRGRPVAVGTGVVASSSYEAKRCGVGTGMRLADARRVCPG